jgi:hypothetical protein
MFTSIPVVETAAGAMAEVDAARESAISRRNAATKRSTRYAAVIAGVVLLGLVSPARATAQQDRANTRTDTLARATATDDNRTYDNRHAALGWHNLNDPIALMSHLPWLAPVGHRQPRKGDVPQDEAASSWESQQQQLNEELDRKLAICRGC